MSTNSKWMSVAVAATALTTLASVSLAAPAEAAAVYCKTAGVPQGCIVRPTGPVVVAPAAVGVTHVGYTRVGAAPVGVAHVGYTRVTPYGVRHVGYTRVRR